jgi:hypothetical protein
MIALATDRERHIHMARVLIQQARLTSKPDRAALYLGWAANRRRLAQGIEINEPCPRGWYRTPGGIVVHCEASGYNGVQCFSTPIERARLTTKEERRQCWPWIFHGFTVAQRKFRPFLARCTFLGTETPVEAINDQVDRIARMKSKAAPFPMPPPAQQVCQLELFA